MAWAVSLLYLLAAASSALACHQVRFHSSAAGAPKEAGLEKVVCRCNATHCDQLGRLEWPLEQPATYLRRLSTGAGEHLRWRADRLIAGARAARAAGPLPALRIRVNAASRRQQILGYGGAFTDSACLALRALPEAVRQHAMRDYFAPDGLHYNLGRLPIGGSDMSWRAYSLDDQPAAERTDDLGLAHFRLQAREDLALKARTVREVNAKWRPRAQPLKLIAASWSAPAWMKTNRRLVQGRLRGNSSRSPYFRAYANYLVRFLHEYERLGVPVFALTPQNEPQSPSADGPRVYNINSMNFEPEEMADFLELHLIPALRRAGRLGPPHAGRLELFLWDDSQAGARQYLEAALRRPLVARSSAGLAYHWYSQAWHGRGWDGLRRLRARLPSNYAMLSTEACFRPPRPGNWSRGEWYARDLIESLNLGTVGWIDWNLALNLAGGPSWAGNLLDAPLLVDARRQLYYKNPMYYALAHVVRFLPAGARVLDSSVQGAAGQPADQVHVAAAELAEPEPAPEPDPEPAQGRGRRRLGLVALNRADRPALARLELAECPLQAGQPALELELPAFSLTSLAFAC